MTAHRDRQDLLISETELIDPGDTNTVNVDRDLAHLSVVTAAAESRVLGVPPKAGLRLSINLKTDGGDLTITQTSGAFNAAGNTTITLDDAGDGVDLISADIDGTMYWRIPGDGAALS